MLFNTKLSLLLWIDLVASRVKNFVCDAGYKKLIENQTHLPWKCKA